MKHFSCIQGSEEWLRLRMGKATASEFERIITPAKKQTKDGEILGWQPTKGEAPRKYAIYLLTELLLDQPLSGLTVAAMDHGHDWEPKARAAYEMIQGVETTECGFCVNDAHTIGASCDSFVGDEGSLEIKCPFKPEIHVSYLMDPALLVEEYWVQTQGQLFVTGRKWTDLISYFSGLPMVRVRLEPDPEFQPRLDKALRGFCAMFSDLVDRCIEKEYLKERPATTGWIESGDVEMIRARRDAEITGDFDITDDEITRIYSEVNPRRMRGNRL